MKPSALTVTLALSVLTTALATVVPALTLEQQARKAEVIVHATVTAVADETIDGTPWKAYRLNVLEAVAGDPSALPVSDGSTAVYVLDGLVDGPKLAKDDEVVLLLYRSRLDSPVVGFNQGVYAVRDGRVVGQDLAVADFKSRLVELRSAQ